MSTSSSSSDDDEPAIGGPQRTCSSCAEPSKYTCPGCAARSCSLLCVRAHKEASGCTGQRATSTYRAMSNFDEQTLLRDYRFLENGTRTLDSADRRLQKAAPNEPQAQATQSPARRELLREARRRGVLLELLPQGMQRQRENTSRHARREHTLRWRVEVVFCKAGVKHAEEAVAEGTTIEDLLLALLLPGRPLDPCATAAAAAAATADATADATAIAADAATAATANATAAVGGAPPPRLGHASNEAQRAVLRHKLREYTRHTHAPCDGLSVFLLAERRAANDPRYHRLPLDESLGGALRGKVVLEFPTIHVATQDEAARFALLEEDAMPRTEAEATTSHQ